MSPISGLSENAFKTVIEIDTVRNILLCSEYLTHPQQLGTYNTVKATIPHVRATKGAYVHVSATLHYRGMCRELH